MSQNFMTKPSFVRFNILVVDDDFTSLSIVSAMLKRWDYDVVTVRRPVEALATIRIQQGIDLVVTDLHMPEMNGIQLQQQINEEFNNLPVMVMSSDDRESVIMKALASGVVFYIVKPLNPVDLKNVWQYAVTSKKGKSIYIEEIGSFEGVGSSADKLSFDDIVSSSSVNEQKKNKKDSKRKASKNGKGGEQDGETVISAPKKAKVAWTNSLHNRFLQAIRHISLEKAVPKKILEFMNVPGLTRENVASHLQKYRIFLKRVAERGAGVASKNFTHRSSFAAAHSAMMLQEAQEYAQIKEKQKQRQQMMRSSSYLPGYGGGISSLNGTIIGSLVFPSLGASSNNSVSQLGLLQGNQANFHQCLFGNTTNPLYQANPGTTFGTGSNDMGSNLLSCGASSFKGFGTLGWNPSYTSGLENIGTFNNNQFSNYAGIQLNDDRELVALGQMRLNGYGLINGTAGNEGATVHHLAGANEQENTSLLPPLSSNQQYGLGNNAPNDFSNLGNIAQPEQFGEGIEFGDFLFDPSNYQFLFQQQAGTEGALNPSSASGSGTHQAQLNLPINQSQNPEFSGAFAVEDNTSSPWNEPTLEQLREMEQILNPELSSNAANAHPLNDYYPSFVQNVNQLQQGNQNILNNSDELNSLMNPRENSPSGNQGWDDEFMDSLFENDP